MCLLSGVLVIGGAYYRQCLTDSGKIDPSTQKIVKLKVNFVTQSEKKDQLTAKYS